MIEPPAPTSPSVCDRYGYVLAGVPLLGPDDPPYAGGPIRPCGVLVCRRCAAPVRIFDDRSWVLECPTIRILGSADVDLERRVAAETPVAYDAADISTYVAPSPGARAYACRCTRITLLGAAYDLWHDDSGLPWACSGRHRTA
jgi:hypothetical protein